MFSPMIIESCVIPGEKYWIQLDGWGGNSGTGRIEIDSCEETQIDLELGACQTHFIKKGKNENEDLTYLVAKTNITGTLSGPLACVWSSDDPSSIVSTNGCIAAVQPKETTDYSVRYKAMGGNPCRPPDEATVRVEVVDVSCGYFGRYRTVCIANKNDYPDGIFETCMPQHRADWLLKDQKIDRLGPCDLTCTASPEMVPINIRLITDKRPCDTTWELLDLRPNPVLVASGGSYTVEQGNFDETVFVCAEGCYQFSISDSGDDGLCSDGVCGSVTVDYDGEDIVTSLSDFGSNFTVQFGSGCESIIDIQDTDLLFDVASDSVQNTSSISILKALSDKDVSIIVLSDRDDKIRIALYDMKASNAPMDILFDGEIQQNVPKVVNAEIDSVNQVRQVLLVTGLSGFGEKSFLRDDGMMEKSDF